MTIQTKPTSITKQAQQAPAGKRDDEAPASLILVVQDAHGNVWGTLTAEAREFKTGSVGFYANGKIKNPLNTDCAYQVGTNLILIGSKGE